MMPSFLKKILRLVLQPLTRWYLSTTRWYTFQDIRIKIDPGVFHPGLFFSTRFMVDYLADEDLKGLRILELGAGSGLLSIFCARRGAIVSASDVSKTALRNLSENVKLTGTSFTILNSDLFDSIDPDDYNLILINPPYYPGTPLTDADKAWYCGNDYQFFKKLFHQLQEKQKTENKIIMVLSEDCDLTRITSLAANDGYFPQQLKEVKNFWEKNYILRWSRGTRESIRQT